MPKKLAALTIAGLAFCATTACAADDPVGLFAGERAASTDRVVSETEELDVDLEAIGSAVSDPASTPTPIDIPDDALDLTGFETVNIDIQDNAFVQRVVVVSEGTEIIWTNQGRNEHNVRPAIPDAFEPIPSSLLASKDSQASLQFNTAGDYPYFCSIHGTATRGQTGRVIVVD
jgi:plastocyanin